MSAFKMTPAITELFDLFVEEGAEATVERSKIRRTGPHYVPYSDPDLPGYSPGKPSNLEAFKTEVMDVMVIAGLICDRGIITQEEYSAHQEMKLAKLEQWAPGVFGV